MKYVYTIIFVLLLYQLSAQNIVVPNVDSMRMARVNKLLTDVATRDTTYRREVDISIGKTPLSELLRNIAKVSEVNITIKGAESTMVTCNFSRAKIIDLISYLCREYDMDIDVVGNIISVHPAKSLPPPAHEPKVDYSIMGNLLSYDLMNDKLIDVSRKISKLAGVNIIIPQSLYTKHVSGFVSPMKIDEALYALFEANELEGDHNKKGVWRISQGESSIQEGIKNRSASTYTRHRQYTANQLHVDSTGMITAQIGRGNISDIIIDLCEQMKLNYFFTTPISQQTSIYVKDVSLNVLLSLLFSGTQYTYYQENGIYVFGSGVKENGLSTTKIIPMRHRSIDKIEELIPTVLKTGLQIKQFGDQNSLIVSGDQRLVSRVETFMESIDRSVPLVTIEVMIVDASKTNIQEAGIKMGLGGAPVKTSGTLSPGINMDFNAASVNSLINSFNGFGSVNLGKVASDFYLSLKFLEENGTIELRSTPKLSTLNGHEATLKSGETKYYKEILNSIIGTQNPIQSESFTWKSIEANLSIKIIPYVTTDMHITLDIEIEQTEFTTREEKDAPPGTSTRSFKSLIKVENEDMVLLGGIERNSRDQTSNGLPFIARVPILRWLFGVSKNNKVEHKLNVFIKPTVID